MKFYEWKNACFGTYDLLAVLTEQENERVRRVFSLSETHASGYAREYFYFIDMKNKIIVPMRELSYAFSGQYNGYPPYGEQVEGLKIELASLSYKDKTVVDEKRR